MYREALYYRRADDGAVVCELCPRGCSLQEGATGACLVRRNIRGKLYSISYGDISSLALDPIEKKPLYRFHPGSYILSAGSYGCNFTCPFCQNHTISRKIPDTIWNRLYLTASGTATEKIFASPGTAADAYSIASGTAADAYSIASGTAADVYSTLPGTADKNFTAPEELVQAALAQRARGNIGIAYTYNEPLVGFEYVLDTARLASREGLYNALVTNGYINQKPLAQLLPYISAMNVDLKGDDGFYKKLCGGRRGPVLDTIRAAVEAGCHVEVTTLLVSGHTDNPQAVDEIAGRIAAISEDIPLHLSRFFPRYKMSDAPPTDVAFVREAVVIARRKLRYVYAGNI